MFNKGITLIETLIYIAIIGLVMASFINFGLSSSDSREKTYVVTEVQANTRIALNAISKAIKSAKSVNTGDSIFDLDPGSISLEMSLSSENPTIIDLDNDDGVLRIKEGTNTAEPIISDEVRVTNLVFTNLTSPNGKESIKVEMTLEFNNTSGDPTYNYSQSAETTISLRH